MHKLSLADAAVEVMATAKGERILACLGELHLEQSILDLKKVYCGKDIELRISDPIVEFGETTEWFENEIRRSTPPTQVPVQGWPGVKRGSRSTTTSKLHMQQVK